MLRPILGLLFMVLVCGGLSRAADGAPAIDLGNGVKLELADIPRGQFVQGSPNSEAGRGEDETQRTVTLSRGFQIGIAPVTKAQWERFVADTKYRSEAESGPSGGFGWDGTQLTQRKEFTWKNPGFQQAGDHPVCIVTYPDAQKFCEWLSRKSGKTVTLPTEAQWEYACRAGTTTAWHHGGDSADEVAWSKSNAQNATHPVKEKKPNAWGLYIGGNVAEWCLDWYGPYPAGDTTDPKQTTAAGEKSRRVIRGGSWAREPKNTRSAARWRNDPQSRNADVGFRVVVLEPEKSTSTGAGGALLGQTTPSTPSSDGYVETRRTEVPSAPAAASPAAPAPTHEEVLLPKSNAPAWFNCLTLACPFAFLAALAAFLFRTLKRSAQAQMPPTMMPPPDPNLQAATMAGAAMGAMGGMRGGSAGAAPVPGISVSNDGFWLLLSDVASGTLVEYAYMNDAGAEVVDRVVYQPGPTGHFIYTGSQPRQVRITNVGGSGADFGDDYRNTGGTSSSFSSGRSSSSPYRPTSSSHHSDDSRRYPSAY